jgi:hypothetical protein
MNQFFYESRGREKLNQLLKEGQVSQAIQKSRAPKPGFLPGAPKLVTMPKLVLSLLGILGFLSHRGH